MMTSPGPAVPPPNPSTLDRGHELGAQLDAIEAAVRAMVADLSVPEPWPGRDVEARRYSDEAIGCLQRARSAIGVLAGVLAQDGKR